MRTVSRRIYTFEDGATSAEDYSGIKMFSLHISDRCMQNVVLNL